MHGRVWRFGDNVSTDQMYPSKYNVATASQQEIASHAMSGADPDFAGRVKPGDVVIGGENFGCGSSRENAANSLKFLGISVVVAEYFGRIFYRNAINVGLPAIEAPGVSKVKEGAEVEIDLKAGTVKDLSTGRVYRGTAIPAFLQEILDEGGLMPYLEKQYPPLERIANGE